MLTEKELLKQLTALAVDQAVVLELAGPYVRASLAYTGEVSATGPDIRAALETLLSRAAEEPRICQACGNAVSGERCPCCGATE